MKARKLEFRHGTVYSSHEAALLLCAMWREWRYDPCDMQVAAEHMPRWFGEWGQRTLLDVPCWRARPEHTPDADPEFVPDDDPWRFHRLVKSLRRYRSSSIAHGGRIVVPAGPVQQQGEPFWNRALPAWSLSAYKGGWMATYDLGPAYGP